MSIPFKNKLLLTKIFLITCFLQFSITDAAEKNHHLHPDCELSFERPLLNSGQSNSEFEIQDFYSYATTNKPKASHQDLLSAALHLASGRNPQVIHPELLNELRLFSHSLSNSELTSPNTLNAIFAELQEQMGEKEFLKSAGTFAVAVKKAVTSPTNADNDLRNMNRAWGWKLLPENDKAFHDPTYLSYVLQQSRASGALIELGVKSDSNPQILFEQAWSKIAPSRVEPPSIFTMTGTDANNSLYDIAERVVKKRKFRLFYQKGPAEILGFRGIYGGGSGRIARLGSAWATLDHTKSQKFLITNPITPYWEPTDPKEIRRLKQLEKKALREIWWKVRWGDSPIGGILLEPIYGASGVYFYRKEFLIQLRQLCDELKIPIFADEILTGGGRTGKFFAYEHYEGFEPDFITFGKGLQVSGIAQVKRQTFIIGKPLRIVTLTQYNEAFLKSAQIMNRIREDHLMENAEKVGFYFINRLRSELLPENTTENEKLKNLRGKGLLIYGELIKEQNVVRDALGRLMPYLTLTEEEVDQLKFKRKYFYSNY